MDKGIKIKVVGEEDFTARLKEYLDFCIFRANNQYYKINYFFLFFLKSIKTKQQTNIKFMFNVVASQTNECFMAAVCAAFWPSLSLSNVHKRGLKHHHFFCVFCFHVSDIERLQLDKLHMADLNSRKGFSETLE